MRCNEIQERFVELLYNEAGTPPASPELRAHIDSCPSCRKELEELKSTQKALRLWGDESPLRPVRVPSVDYYANPPRSALWRVWRYAAVAAMLLIAFLALANPEITWNKEGFSFRTNVPWSAAKPDYYTKEETRMLLKRVIDDSEKNMTEADYLMMQELLNTIEQDRAFDLRLVRHQAVQNHNKN